MFFIYLFFINLFILSFKLFKYACFALIIKITAFANLFFLYNTIKVSKNNYSNSIYIILTALVDVNCYVN
jgi:hypothetical protein